MEGMSGKRRLVQSTLFPHKERSLKEAENCDGNGGEDAAEECIVSSKKGNESKRKTSVKKKASPALSKKVTKNGKITPENRLDDSNSPNVAKSNFFVKSSERLQQTKQQIQQMHIDSREDNDDICTPPSSASNGSTPGKLKWRVKSIPRKEMTLTPDKKMKRGSREPCFGHIPFDLTLDDPSLQTIPDLRLEAKRTAEETSRIYFGRQIHPFFTSLKGGKSRQDSEKNWSSFETKEKGITFNPIHVFENVEVDHVILDWGQWMFFERSAMNDLGLGCSPVYGESVNSLNSDKVSHYSTTSLGQNSDQSSITRKEVFTEMPDQQKTSHHVSPLSFANTAMCSEHEDSDMLPKDTTEILANSVHLASLDNKYKCFDFFGGSSCEGNLSSELQEKLCQERIMSHYHTCSSDPENCLWTDKYQPRNAKQICGNCESVTFLGEWLHLWHKKHPLTSRSCHNEGKSYTRDIDHNYLQSASDSDSMDGDESLNNVLLVTGPVGSGKSAAIYSCAKDQGFQVIEINASDWRNGALIKQKFGEAVESHWLQRRIESGPHPDNKSMSKYLKAESHCSKNEVVELIDLSGNEAPEDTSAWTGMPVFVDNKDANYRNEIKSLILFEDVDVSLYEDHGFLTTIQQLADTAKRPMILTSNSDNPVLPKNLDRSELSFSSPSPEELLELLYKIFAAENTKLHPRLVERFVDHCHGDIRKTIMLLQFWFQGQTLRPGTELCQTCSPVPFDIDAAHHILPKVIPWGYPSQLSELVDKEVVESLNLLETYYSEDLIDYRPETIYTQDGETDPFEAKKEAILKLHCSFQDEFEYAQFENSGLSDSSGSPVAFAQQNRKRKINTVFSSDSEDDAGDSIVQVSAGLLDINVEVLNSENISSSHFLSTEQIYHSETNKLVEDCSWPHIDENACKSFDMSIVPESSYVPETEIPNETLLYSTSVSNTHFGGNSFSIQDKDSIHIQEPAVCLLFNKSLHIEHNEEETLRNHNDASTAHVYLEEVGDSVSKSETNIPLLRGHRLLDECSRIDFTRLKSSPNPETEKVIDYVQETWNRLRDQRKDLKKYVTKEERIGSQVLMYAHGMSNLISEADLLLKDCDTVVSDYLISSMIPSERGHSYSYYDNQLEMASVLAQHGMCFYAMKITSFGSIIGPMSRLNLASEMLSASASSIALGKLAGKDHRTIDSLVAKTPKNSNFLTRKVDSCLCNVLESVVPSKSYLAAKGNAFHEYISTLSQLSRFEDTRSSECLGKGKLRRGCVAQHYLSSGSLAMSTEDISLLGRYNNYQKYPFLLGEKDSGIYLN